MASRFVHIAVNELRKVLNRTLQRALPPEEERPNFMNPDDANPSLRLLQKNYQTIKKEAEALLASGLKLPKYHEIDQAQIQISNADEREWRLFPLYINGMIPEAAQQHCPETLKLIQQIPDVFQAFFSILAPGKSVPAHRGPYIGFYRTHLGLIVPEKNTPEFRVRTDRYVWKEGDLMTFEDYLEHEVTNHCDEERLVLIVDTLRPFPGWADKLNRLTMWMLIKNYYGKRVAANFENALTR